jgi:hypothetical protein
MFQNLLKVLFSILYLTKLSKTAYNGYIDINKFQQKMRETINSIRYQHGANGLALDPVLTNTAQLYAMRLAVSDSGLVKDHNDLINCGILIESMQSITITDNYELMCGETLVLSATRVNISENCDPIYIAQLWNSQRINYNYSNPNNNNELPSQRVLDFTQLIW